MGLRLYNTLTRQKEAFTPLDPARVRMYVCGPTVYDRAHVGNARPVIVFDVLFRLLRYLYRPEHVTYVRNITDVDDKINARALEQRIPIRQLTEETYRWFQEDVAALGTLPPTAEPRATEYIEPMKELIERLVMAECAYVAEDHVLFHVAAMPDYGKLSHRSLDDMIAGARVEVAPYKKDPVDFVLWKPSKPGEPAWPSPAGIKTPGRPGWHIECSAMSWKHLGETFDIHGGGIDLVFPHHENELAQSRCAFGTKLMAQVWMHNGFVQMEGEKMAKSEGNVITIREALQQSPNNPHWGEVLRLNMLRTHYRQPTNWTQDSLTESMIVYASLQRAVTLASRKKARPSEQFLAALMDDLNAPAAISELHRLAVKAKSDDGPADAANELVGSLLLLGFDGAVAHVKEGSGTRVELERAFQETLAQEKHVNVSDVDARIAARNAARARRDFIEADRIRDELKQLGVELEDKKDGTTIWKIAS